MRKILADDIATAVDFSIQVQMNQWKIVWLPVWINFNVIFRFFDLISVLRPFNTF